MIYSIEDIARIVKAKDRVIKKNDNISVLLTDSRSLTFPEESLFFCIVTPQNDGHKYIEELYRKGVRNFVVSKPVKRYEQFPDGNFIHTPNTLTALQQVATAHRSRFSIPVIAITGSNGKTIVKEWLYQLLHEDYNIIRSPRSYNSQIGVPLSVWEMNEDTELAIFEAGISNRGEMDKLKTIIKPDLGVLTNIGEAHQENFTSLNEKCIEKLSLFTGCDSIIYNGGSTLITDCIEKSCIGSREIAWSLKDPNQPLYIPRITKDIHSTTIVYLYLGYRGQFTIPFTGDAAIENALHCLSVMLFLGKTPQVIAERMSRLEPVAMRLEVKEGSFDSLIINDTYNSDYNSLEIAVDFLSRRATASGLPMTLILSDILQSGDTPESLYKKVADLIHKKGISKIIGIGKDISANEHLFKMKKQFFSSTEAFLQHLQPVDFAREVVLVKGARVFHFETISEMLELKKHETILEVSLDAVVHNFNYFKRKLRPETKIICMVKAFGYGAGSYELAKTLQEHGCDYLAVAVADEGADLRKSGISLPIMVMNPELHSFRTLFENALEPEVYSFRLLAALIKSAEQLGITNYPIHIKIDSGMHRLGFEEKDMDQLTDMLRNQRSVIVRSVFSHLAGSDEEKFDDFTKHQITYTRRCAERIQSISSHRILFHILNTAGISRFPEEQMDMVRLGIGLYGISASGTDTDLHLVSTLKTTILQIKELLAGETVGYGRRGILERDSKIAAIPIGYADGVDRHLGNRNGYVIVHGMKAPIVGNVCMDVCMIDVTDIPCEEGDKVIIFGKELPPDEIAHLLGTIPYEIITSVSSRVKRVYYRE